jgi:hypothetical protein
MRKLILTISVCCLSLFSAVGQQQPDTNSHRQRAIIGVHAGALFSSIDYITDKLDLQVVGENFYMPGGSAGITLSLINSKNFSIQPELNVQVSHHDINYSHLKEEYQSYECTYADYALTLATLQTSALFKVRTGKKFMTYLGVGPYANFPIYHSTKGLLERLGRSSTILPYDIHLYNNDIVINFNTTVGAIVATGINVPFRNNNFGIEFRYYISPGKLIKDPDIRQNFTTLCLTYQFISKKNVW